MPDRTLRQDLTLILVTAFCGAALTYFFQERAASHRQEGDLREARSIAATQLFQSVGPLMDRRVFLWSRVYGAYRAGRRDTLRQEAIYDKARAEWNASLLTNTALLCRYFGYKMGDKFTGKILPGFAGLDEQLRDYRRCDLPQKRGENLLGTAYDDQRRAVFKFNLELVDMLRRGTLPEDDSEGKCSDLKLGGDTTGSTTTPRASRRCEIPH